jgi:1,4-dihydroxy-2-naphthoyl-CoA synthase
MFTEAGAFKIEARIGMEVVRSQDAKEGPRAFTEKRTPDFHDR